MVSFFRNRKREEVRPEGESDGSPDGQATGVEALNTLKAFERAHHLDPNLPLDELNEVDNALNSDNAEKGLAVEQVLVEENSPYPEVRASVRNYDVEMPANTIRAWTIGLILCTVGSGVNMLFSLRFPSVTVTTYVIQLIAYPIGLLWDLVFPNHQFNVFGLKFNFKPGPFNFKEHVVIVVMSNAAYAGGALYATDIMITQKFYYGQDFGWGWQILFGITTLCTGYGIAGVARRFLVWPAAMIWPADLVNAALFYTLHDHAPSDPTKTNGWSIGRYRWFLYVFTGAFVWYWFPGWIFQGLSFFAWITWIRPDDVILNQIFGNNTGYGIIPLCFDWTVISAYLNSPLIPPFWAIANNIAGVLIFFVFVSMGLRYSHKWYYDYLPVQSSRAFDNTGAHYNVSLILNADNTFNEEAYHAYSPLYLSSQFTLCYGVAFASVAAVIVHVTLYHGREIVSQFKMARHQEDDVHMRMIKKYREAPDWWYLVLFVIMVGISFGVVCGWDTGFPAWGYVVCMLIPLFWTIPIGIVQAITNIQLGLNVITEFIVGYMIPGHPLAMMMFKNYGYLAMSQGLYFIQDLKLGHYMKVPPRVMFWSQLVASVWSAIVQVAVMRWALTAIPDICTPNQPNGYSCPNANVFYTASVIWGVIGPKRMFNGNALYQPLQYFWIAGALAPIVTYVLARRWPKSIFRYINTPIIFGGNGNIPPATVFVYLCWGTVGTIFNFFIRRKYTGWWLQYNYVTSAALDSGLIVSTIIVFFGLYISLATPPQWFGNLGALSTLDAGNAAILSVLPPGQTFGPSTWD